MVAAASVALPARRGDLAYIGRSRRIYRPMNCRRQREILESRALVDTSSRRSRTAGREPTIRHDQRVLGLVSRYTHPERGVRRNETSRYACRVRAWARPPEILVILDRRHGERRRNASGLEAARRWRAGQRTRQADFSNFGSYTMRFTGTAARPDPDRTT